MDELIRKWQSGDENAFDELFHQYKWLVFKNALIITGSNEEAKDILQEVFVKVWKFRHTFNAEKGRFISWLYRITISQSISRYRKKKTPPLSLDEIDTSMLGTSQQELTEKVLDCKWEYERLLKLLDQMNEKHRIVLILRYFDDLPISSIAEILDIPIGTVKSRIHNALIILKVQMESADTDIDISDRKTL